MTIFEWLIPVAHACVTVPFGACIGGSSPTLYELALIIVPSIIVLAGIAALLVRRRYKGDSDRDNKTFRAFIGVILAAALFIGLYLLLAYLMASALSFSGY